LHFHEHHKELDKFIHVAKNVEKKVTQAQVHHDDHDHIIDLHVKYEEKLASKAQYIDNIKAQV
jgi:hypothetical protein